MSNIVHLKWGEQPTRDSLYLLVRRMGRVRGDDFYVDPCDGLAPEPAPLDEPRTFASLTSALRAAETRAERCGVETIYVRMGG
jgi:hypothetical protein